MDSATIAFRGLDRDNSEITVSRRDRTDVDFSRRETGSSENAAGRAPEQNFQTVAQNVIFTEAALRVAGP